MPLPEKVLQFGTGILLRGLPDFFIDRANKKGIFNGKILVVKSTPGSVTEFSDLGCRFETYVRGIENGKKFEEKFSNESISRVLSAVHYWPQILEAASNMELRIIISNTTEVGLQYKEESVFQSAPESFPAKLTAFLYERFRILGKESPVTIVIPTELIPGNGEKLRSIVEQLIAFNELDTEFSEWLDAKIIFCNSLVDRIVTRPSDAIRKEWTHPDPLAIQTEPYRLWAIEGNSVVRDILSFAAADDGLIVAENIDYYRERKLRLLNGTHTISVCLGFLKGHTTVFDCMEDLEMHGFIEDVMMKEILPTLILGSVEQNSRFGNEVLDRFHNPFTEHKLLNITLQSTMKMRMRNIPTILNYYSAFGKAPTLLVKGFAAYLFFMKVAKIEDGKYFGRRGPEYYPIQDDAAGHFYEQWKNDSVPELVQNICGNTQLWETDLTLLSGFTEAVTRELLLVQEGKS
jgi:tagaturonate reductase